MKGAGLFGTGFLGGLVVGSALTAGALWLMRGTAELALETEPELETEPKPRRGHKAAKTSAPKQHAAKGHAVRHDDVSRRN
jgi:hypothetical protein